MCGKNMQTYICTSRPPYRPLISVARAAQGRVGCGLAVDGFISPSASYVVGFRYNLIWLTLRGHPQTE